MADIVFVPHDEQEYGRLAELLDGLIDEVGEDESHPLASLMEIMSVLIENYEAEHAQALTSEWTRRVYYLSDAERWSAYIQGVCHARTATAGDDTRSRARVPSRARRCCCVRRHRR